MVYDYKKEFKTLYCPSDFPEITEIPKMNFVAVRGKGNPNDADGEYSKAVGLLYAVEYTIKMSKKSDNKIDGYFDYVVPPLEGLWWMADGSAGIDYNNKSEMCWISMIRLPEFVDGEVFKSAIQTAAQKKKIDVSKAELFEYDEGLCVQCMHHGPFDDEPETVSKLTQYAEKSGYSDDMESGRFHHEIYLGDPRKTSPEKLRTIIRHPIK